MDGFRTGIRDQSLQITGNTLRPAEIHGTRQMVSLRPIILEEEDTVHIKHHVYSTFNKKLFLFTVTVEVRGDL